MHKAVNSPAESPGGINFHTWYQSAHWIPIADLPGRQEIHDTFGPGKK